MYKLRPEVQADAAANVGPAASAGKGVVLEGYGAEDGGGEGVGIAGRGERRTERHDRPDAPEPIIMQSFMRRWWRWSLGRGEGGGGGFLVERG